MRLFDVVPLNVAWYTRAVACAVPARHPTIKHDRTPRRNPATTLKKPFRCIYAPNDWSAGLANAPSDNACSLKGHPIAFTT